MENDKLTVFFGDWKAAADELQVASQTIQQLQVKALAAEARFKGAFEILHGADAQWAYTPEGGVVVVASESPPG